MSEWSPATSPSDVCCICDRKVSDGQKQFIMVEDDDGSDARVTICSPCKRRLSAWRIDKWKQEHNAQ